MRTLIIGYSSIAARRALPALLRLSQVDAVDIASRRPLDRASLPEKWTGQTYDDYGRAIDESRAELVYVSLVNSLHEAWADAALRAGRHVVVDKPAVLSLAAAERLLELAAERGLCLAEAVVFADHPQVKALQGLVSEAGGVTRLMAVFSVPPLPAHNFRNDPELGGGCLYDLGPYAAATGRIFFDDAPETVECRVVSWHPETKVDTAFSILATYGDGRSYVGHYGFDTEYQNRITAIGPGLAVTADRIFTTPPDLENELVVDRRNHRSSIVAQAGDAFERFFARVIAAVESGSWSSMADDMLRDARMLEDMRMAAQAGCER